MAKLPILTSDQVIKALEKVGFQVVRQKGSHVRLRHQHHEQRVATVPIHSGKTIGRGLLGKILRTTELTQEEFITLI